MLINRIPFPAGGGFDPIKDISYTGAYTAEEKTIDGIAYWLLTFTGSGTLTVNKEGLIGDVCVCGGGSGGAPGNSRDKGNGGNGGFVNNYTNQEIISGDITIGAGGNANAAGGTTSFGTLTANGGTAPRNTYGPAVIVGGSSGGCGGRNSMSYAKGQGTTTRPFGSADMDPLGAGGGGGSTHDEYLENYYNGGAGGTDGGNGGVVVSSGGIFDHQTGGAGGNKGGGKGADCLNTSVPGTPENGTYYGAGGGGGAIGYDRSNEGYTGTAGEGYQGVVMIRIPK